MALDISGRILIVPFNAGIFHYNYYHRVSPHVKPFKPSNENIYFTDATFVVVRPNIVSVMKLVALYGADDLTHYVQHTSYIN